MLPNKRVFELEFIRTLSMIAVIVLHGSGDFIASAPMFILNQITRFAVPAFILISGIGLSVSGKRSLLPKLPALLVPYLFWCIVYGNMLLPHLYFIPVLLQLYLLFPLLLRCVRKWTRITLTISLLISLAANLLPYLAGLGIELRPEFLIRPHLWWLFPTWLFYFVLGLSLERETLERLTAFAARKLLPLSAAALAVAALYIAEAKVTGTFYDSVKPSQLIYAPMVCLTLAGLARKLSGNSRIRKAVAFGTKHSQTVYYTHVIVLRWLGNL
ncbi:MAG: acyltransferase [Oscillospiraceae bacterium]|jgi:surface polysaccharide O-acyltransferase-like enzyme|nr:acyltransferase [Oscillospiraceae bacterium]